jgi:hypothetical protein
MYFGVLIVWSSSLVVCYKIPILYGDFLIYLLACQAYSVKWTVSAWRVEVVADRILRAGSALAGQDVFLVLGEIVSRVRGESWQK